MPTAQVVVSEMTSGMIAPEVEFIFMLSLIGAYILFKVLRATAMIKNTKFQAGGALAGFVILYGTMFQSYQSLQNVKEIEGRLKEAKDEIGFLKTRMDASQIKGTIIPTDRNTKIVLAVKQADPDENGQFRLSASCIDPEKDDIKVFVISEKGYKFKSIFSRDEMKGIQINVQ